MRLLIDSKSYELIISHLLPTTTKLEQAAYLFARHLPQVNALRFQDMHLMSEQDFVRQQDDYLELSDQTRAMIIKKAHMLDCALVEMHSHPAPWPAMFSRADFIGLHETVPHMQWRLPQKPYMALVVAYGSFDGLVWPAQAKHPVAVEAIAAGEKILKPTNLSVGRR